MCTCPEELQWLLRWETLGDNSSQCEQSSFSVVRILLFHLLLVSGLPELCCVPKLCHSKGVYGHTVHSYKSSLITEGKAKHENKNDSENNSKNKIIKITRHFLTKKITGRFVLCELGWNQIETKAKAHPFLLQTSRKLRSEKALRSTSSLLEWCAIIFQAKLQETSY